MNATKFVVLVIFVGVVCANVGARQVQEVSKETKLGISNPKPATYTNGIGAELDSVTGTTSAYNSENSNANAAAGPDSPSASSSGSVYKSTYGTISAEGPDATITSYSNAFGNTGAGAAAGPNGASSDAFAYGDASSGVGGTTGSNP